MTQLEIVLPSQYFAPPRNHAPEYRLMVAVLHDALACLDKYRFATSSRDRRHFREATRWFLAKDLDWPYSFERICNVLSLDARAVRRRLCMQPAPRLDAEETLDSDSDALTTLRGWQFDPRLNGSTRRKARQLLWRFQANGWDEV
jgi:hypothetical protein